MPEQIKLTHDQKKQILPVLRRAVVAQAQRWDAELEIERIVGKELNTEEIIKHLAAALDAPARRYDANFIKLGYLDEFIEQASK